jgi:hypothetical protein
MYLKKSETGLNFRKIAIIPSNSFNFYGIKSTGNLSILTSFWQSTIFKTSNLNLIIDSEYLI